MFQRWRRRQPPDAAVVGAEFLRRGPIRVTERWLFTEAGVFEIHRIEDVYEFRHGLPWTGWMTAGLAAAGGTLGVGAGLLPNGLAQRICLAGALLLPLAAAASAILGARPAVQLFTVQGGVPRVLANVPTGSDARRIRRALAKARRSSNSSSPEARR